ncbi:MAG: aminomethyl transferase family protein [Acidobacteria bacterium]|nr:aminomethyl transferase family protein [Acidobacteriota bacterium]
MTSPEQYRALKDRAAIGAIAPRKTIGVAGKDRAGYLQGLLTNDIQALTPGTGCYAAWLTPQGRMLTDMHVFESGDMILLDVPADALPATLQRLDQFLFSEDVQFADLSETLDAVWVHGPAASSMLEQVVTGASGLALGFAAWSEYHNTRAEFGGLPVVVARVSQLGVPGFVIYIEPARRSDLRRALVERGAIAAEHAAIEAARVEAGYPLFGLDMTEETIPLEAGIEDRAISLSKGCYVGQEVIIRVLHRGHGRVAKRLVALRMQEGQPQNVPARGARIFSEAREVGGVTSAASSPRLGPIALGYVHRDFVTPGTRVEVETRSGRAAAIVSELGKVESC